MEGEKNQNWHKPGAGVPALVCAGEWGVSTVEFSRKMMKQLVGLLCPAAALVWGVQHSVQLMGWLRVFLGIVQPFCWAAPLRSCSTCRCGPLSASCCAAGTAPAVRCPC